MTRIQSTVAATLLALTSAGLTDSPPRIAIIIDDLGYQLEAGRRAIRLPGPVSYAILPQTPRAGLLAEAAHSAGKEVLLHLPMQANGNQTPSEPGSITLDMSQQITRAAFAAAVASVPHAIGINSHRGSLLTRHPGHMRWLMEEIHAREDLFFIDSYTTPASVAMQIAAETGVAALKRDVFLDHDNTPDAIAQEFKRLKAMARTRGVAIAIGHPYPATLEMLERELPKLAGEGFELVAISALITPRPEVLATRPAETAQHNSDLPSLQLSWQRANDATGITDENLSVPVATPAKVAEPTVLQDL